MTKIIFDHRKLEAVSAARFAVAGERAKDGDMAGGRSYRS
jgi:hypothetical protein